MAVTFGDFTLDAATRRLLRAGAEVHLSPKAFDLLAMLVERRAQAMPKADLLTHLWPGTFVLESNLASLVAEIRRALADSAEAPRFIRTVPRFGYWFVGVVTADAPAPAAAPFRCWLVWDAGQVSLARGDNVLGRAPDSTIWLDVAGVSRRHAVIRLADHGAIVEDLGSKNGTFVGEERLVAPRVLADGDRVRLGQLQLTFRVPQPADLTESIDAG